MPPGPLDPSACSGPPASGKTTLAERLATEIGAPVIRPRDAIHKAVGRHPATICLFSRDQHGRVPDASLGFALRVTLEELAGPVILENLPWDAIQLADLYHIAGPQLLILYLHAEDSLVARRRSGRTYCAKCYPLAAPADSSDACGRCGTGLTDRPDDRQAEFLERLGLNRKLTAQVLKLAFKLQVPVHHLEATRTPEALASEALSALATNIN